MSEWISSLGTSITSFISAHANEIGVMIGVYIAGRIGVGFLCRFFLKRYGKNVSLLHAKRLQTIAGLLSIILHTGLMLAIAIWILRLFGVDPSPIFASAGILGLAVGFGAQALVRDFLSGMFIIVENQYGVGDWVRINGQEGEVKALSIRHTLLEDKDGNHVFIPNGTISLVVNLKHAPSEHPVTSV